MKYVRNWSNFIQNRHLVLAIGKFDGMHRGHRKLIDTVCALGEEYNCEKTVMAFCPSPSAENDDTYLQTRREKRLYFEEAGIESYLEIPFSIMLRNLDAEMFAGPILRGRLHVDHLVVGEDFCFGKGRKGNARYLAENQDLFGYETHIIPEEIVDGRKISSTWIRELVSEGRMEQAAALTGRPYSIRGTVVHGKQLGRAMGFPTANIIPEREKLLPPFGVYQSSCVIDGKRYRGIANIGVKPTVTEERKVTLEMHLPGADVDLYGRDLKVELMSFLRPERPFSDISELKKQIADDVASVK